MECTEAFLNRSNVAYMNPGKKGKVYIDKFNGERKYKKSVICCGQHVIYLKL